MAKHITIDDNLDTFAQTVDEVYHAIRTTNATYHSQLEPISSDVSNLSFGSWDDDVKKKLEECVETTLKTGGVYAIEDDFSSGGLKQLLDNMDQLYIDSDYAKTLKEKYVTLKNKRANEPETVDGQPNTNRPSADAVQRAKNNTQDVIDSINSTLTTIAGIVFGGGASSSSAPETPGFTYNVTEAPYDNSALNREDFSYDGGRKKITIEMAGEDSPTGNMYWTQYGSPVNKTKTIQVMMGEDGKYYEYVTYTETDSFTGEKVFTETTRRELAGDPTTITFTTTDSEGKVVGEKTVSVFLDSELGQLGYNQMLIDSGIDTGLYLTSTFGDGATVNLPDGRTVTVRSEGGSGEWHQPRNGQTIDRNDPTLTVVTPDADGKIH